MAKHKPTHLTITVKADGAVSTDFLHFTGSACLETGRQLHALLAEFGLETDVTSFTPKPELGAAAPATMVVPLAEIQHEGGR